jgi:hypothetical protein
METKCFLKIELEKDTKIDEEEFYPCKKGEIKINLERVEDFFAFYDFSSEAKDHIHAEMLKEFSIFLSEFLRREMK